MYILTCKRQNNLQQRTQFRIKTDLINSTNKTLFSVSDPLESKCISHWRKSNSFGTVAVLRQQCVCAMCNAALPAPNRNESAKQIDKSRAPVVAQRHSAVVAAAITQNRKSQSRYNISQTLPMGLAPKGMEGRRRWMCSQSGHRNRRKPLTEAAADVVATATAFTTKGTKPSGAWRRQTKA